MQQIVRDYSRPGDTVYDPFAGHATTGVAALQLGRHFVGDEIDADAHAAGLARLQRVVAQPSLFAERDTMQAALIE
jgi:site-specific DNA-methyltransferase (adenine-specific)